MKSVITIEVKGKIVHGRKKNKTRVTVFVTVNADGLNKRKATLINKSETPVCFRQEKSALKIYQCITDTTKRLGCFRDLGMNIIRIAITI